MSLYREELTITVSDPAKLGDSINAYVTYKINTKTNRKDFGYTQFCVVRRYSDFVWLHERLHIEFPGAIIPPTPQKTFVGRFSSEFIEARQKALQRFLNRIAIHPELSYSTSFGQFLSSDDVEFARIKESTTTSFVPKIIPKNIDFNPTPSGFMQWFDETMSNFSATMQQFRSETKTQSDMQFEEMGAYINDLEVQLLNVSKQTSTLIRRTHDLASAFGDFGLAFSQLGKNEIDDTSDICVHTGQTIHQVSTLTTEEALDESEYFEAPFNELLGLASAVKVALQKRQDKRVAFFAAQNELSAKENARQRQQNSPNIALLEESVKQAQDNLDKAREEFDTASDRLLREIEYFKSVKVYEIQQLIVSYVQLQIEYCQKVEKSWQQLIPELNSITQNRPPPQFATPPIRPNTFSNTNANANARSQQENSGNHYNSFQPNDKRNGSFDETSDFVGV